MATSNWLSLNVTSLPVNTTTEAGYGRNDDLAKIEIAVQSTILAIAVFGNCTVLLVLGTRKKKLSRMNMMIMHLSLADLFVAFFNVLPQLIWDITYRFYGGDFMCRAVKYFQVIAMFASSYVLVTTAMDRYLAICHPLTAHTWTSKKMHLMVGLAWLLSLVFATPQLFIFAYREIEPYSDVYDCWAVFKYDWAVQAYVTWTTVAIYIMPFLMLTVAYGRICFVVWSSMQMKENSCRDKKLVYRSSDKHENGSLLKYNLSSASAIKNGGNHERVVVNSNPRAHVKGVSKAKVKTVKLTMTVIICYLLCWGPFFISQMWAAWDVNAPFTGPAYTIMVLLASLNSCFNPWIYLVFTDDLCGKLRRLRLSRLYTVSNAFAVTMLLASLNSCTNPWVYLAFSAREFRRMVRNQTARRRYQSTATLNSESRFKSLADSKTDITRLETTTYPQELNVSGGNLLCGAKTYPRA